MNTFEEICDKAGIPIHEGMIKIHVWPMKLDGSTEEVKMSIKAALIAGISLLENYKKRLEP